jgi:hypothetical protein
MSADKIDTRKFLIKILDNWSNHPGHPPEFSEAEDQKIQEGLALEYLSPDAFQDSNRGFLQNLGYPLTDKGKSLIEEHFWLRLKRKGWMQMMIDLMAVSGFALGVILTVLKVIELYQR